MSTNAGLLLDIQRATDVGTLPAEALFHRWVQAALEASEWQPSCSGSAELTIRLVDELESEALNLQYRGQPKPTNVLSFPADLPPEWPLEVLGDLVICAPIVIQEAAQQHKPPMAHWTHMVVHGVLHLLGYDHINDRDAECMESLEIRILAELGVPNPYSIMTISPETPMEGSTQNHG